MAACQCITFLIDSARQEEHSQKQFASEADTFDLYSLDGYFEIDRLLESIENCTRHKVLSLGKDEQKILKSNFKNFSAGVNDGTCPVETLSVGSESAQIRDWASVVQVNYFREFLQGGLLPHLLTNDLLHQIFEIDESKIHVATRGNFNRAERKAFQSKNSTTAKERTKELRKAQRKTVVADD